MNGILTGFFGAIVEAWAQLRIGKLRVLLSLVGVAAAVAAMTFVIALGRSPSMPSTRPARSTPAARAR